NVLATVPLSAAFSPSQSGNASIHKKRQSKVSKTSLDLSNAMFVRGGGDVVLKNFYRDALGFFGGIRIPATFLAGSSLAAIFTLKSAAASLSNDNGKLSKIERRAIKFYHLVSVMAFLLSLNTIILATSAYTSILHGRFDQLAETAYLMMKREFEYEASYICIDCRISHNTILTCSFLFIAVRWSFLTSMFCFLGMITSRVLIEFDLLKVDASKSSTKRDVAALVVCSVGALAAQLMSYVNQNLWCWNSLIGMTVHVAKMVLNCAIVEKNPMQIISVALTMASIFYVAKLAINDINQDDCKDTKKSL
ncbi:hypothetical protein ACHAXN_008186, partial [Cyclotella atomus]